MCQLCFRRDNFPFLTDFSGNQSKSGQAYLFSDFKRGKQSSKIAPDSQPILLITLRKSDAVRDGKTDVYIYVPQLCFSQKPHFDLAMLHKNRLKKTANSTKRRHLKSFKEHSLHSTLLNLPFY